MTDVVLPTKVCTKCGEEKSLEGFSPSTRGRQGRNSQCKACMNAQVKAYQARKRAELGDEAWRKIRRDTAYKSREKPSVRARQLAYKRARHKALTDLTEAHPEQFEKLLNRRMYEEGLL